MKQSKYLLILLSAVIILSSTSFAWDASQSIMDNASDKDANVTNLLGLGVEVGFPGVSGLSVTFWALKYIGVEAIVFYYDEGTKQTTRSEGKLLFCFRNTRSVRNYIAASAAQDSWVSNSGSIETSGTSINYLTFVIGSESFSTIENPKKSTFVEVGFGQGSNDSITFTSTCLKTGYRFYF